MSDYYELLREEQGIPADCPFTGQPCYDEYQCGECQISDDYRRWLEEQDRKEEPAC